MSPIYILNNRRTNNKTRDEWNNKKSFSFYQGIEIVQGQQAVKLFYFFSCTFKISREGSENKFDFCWSSQRVVLLISSRFAAILNPCISMSIPFLIALNILLFLHTFLVFQFLLFVLLVLIFNWSKKELNWSWKFKEKKNLPIIVWLLKC